MIALPVCARRYKKLLIELCTNCLVLVNEHTPTINIVAAIILPSKNEIHFLLHINNYYIPNLIYVYVAR